MFGLSPVIIIHLFMFVMIHTYVTIKVVCLLCATYINILFVAELRVCHGILFFGYASQIVVQSVINSEFIMHLVLKINEQIR